MALKLTCPICTHEFQVTPETPAGRPLAHITEGKSWFAMGDAQTFEDMIFARLATEGPICCPSCGNEVAVSETDLSDLARDLLARC